jgi:hypothetical protein
MLRILFLTLGLTGALANLCAQDKIGTRLSDKPFAISMDSIDRRFRIDLGKGNSMQVELFRLEDLDRFDNVDSLLMTFLGDIKPLQDSLSDPLSGKHIDYLIDPAGRKKVRLRQTKPDGNSYLLDNEGLASLKLEQDTIVMTFHNPLFRMTFYLNEWNELSGYAAIGLNEKLRSLRHTNNKQWSEADQGGAVHLTNDRSISAERTAGFTHLPKDRLETIARINLQNYQNYFVPSVSLGLEIYFSNHLFHSKRPSAGEATNHIWLAWEPMFFFAQTAQPGKLQVMRTDFFEIGLTLWDTQPAERSGTRINFVPGISIASPIYRQGTYVDQNMTRIGLGKFKIWGNAALLEPCFYYQDFLRNITPAVRLCVNL